MCNNLVPMIVALFWLSASSFALPARGMSPEEAASKLVERLLPGRSQQFVFQTIPQQGGCDVFELESRDGKLVVRGNSALSMAFGLNWYLKYYGHCNVVHQRQPVESAQPAAAGGEEIPPGQLGQVALSVELLHFRLCEALVGLGAVGEVHRLDGPQRREHAAGGYRPGRRLAGGLPQAGYDRCGDRGVPSRPAISALLLDGMPGRSRRAVAEGLDGEAR